MTIALLLYLVPLVLIHLLYLFFKWKGCSQAHYIIFLQCSLIPLANIVVAGIQVWVLIDEIKNKFKDE